MQGSRLHRYNEAFCIQWNRVLGEDIVDGRHFGRVARSGHEMRIFDLSVRESRLCARLILANSWKK